LATPQFNVISETPPAHPPGEAPPNGSLKEWPHSQVSFYGKKIGVKEKWLDSDLLAIISTYR
jgi:hypothetical protein